jgi:alanine racemase
MDQLMIDVSEIPEVKTGEIVTLIGKDGRSASPPTIGRGI